MTEREALERIANGTCGHEDYCGEESCRHAEDFARAVLLGRDPDAPKPKRKFDTILMVKEVE
jgi:hypothetical protein